MSDDLSLLDCGSCGAAIASATPGQTPGWYFDGEDVTCGDCLTVNRISVDETDAYVSCWMCKHGKSDEEPCDLCEIEEGGGVGEVAQ